MPQLFIAQPLQKLLQYWEDTNLSGEFNFLLSQIIKKDGKTPPKEAKIDALIGSELNGIGLLARSIPDYQNLRKILEGHSLTHSTNFLPRIPKDFRIVFDDYQMFVDHQFVQTPINIPTFFLKWNETKRICIVEDSIPMPLIDMRKENWLEKIPYHSFFLQIKSPLVFLDTEGREWSVKDMLVYDDGEYIRVLAWPEEIEKFTLTTELRKELANAIPVLKKGKTVDPKALNHLMIVNDWFMLPFIIQKQTGLLKDIHSLAEVKHIDIYDENLPKKDDENSTPLYLQMRVLLETVNGFCKLMATLPPKLSVTVIDSNTQIQNFNPPRQWFELPLQVVEYFHTEIENELLVIKRGNGSEKSPHIRRGHTRRCVRKDGTINEVWIEETTIRADKLVTQSLQGGALKVQ